MKQLWIMRHARAEENLHIQDFDRSLTQQGVKDATKMSEILKKLRIVPDIILFSPAKRTTQTCEIAVKVCGWNNVEQKSESLLYQASSETVIDILHEYFENRMRIFLVGHNPSLTELAGLISTSPIQFLPPAGWYQVNFYQGEKGKVEDFHFPSVNC